MYWFIISSVLCPRRTSVTPTAVHRRLKSGLDKKLAIGYGGIVARSNQIQKAARALAQRSVEARKEAWGEDGFRRRMREWGKLGGRPRKATIKPRTEVPRV
jgi:hypothetical protein